MVSTKILGVGTALTITGFCLIVAEFLNITNNPLLHTFGIGALYVGITMMVFSILMLAGREIVHTDEQDHRDDQSVFMLSVLRAMVAMSVTQNQIDARKITYIPNVYKHITGKTITAEMVNETASDILSGQVQIKQELSGVQNRFSKTSKENIIRACLHVMAKDGALSERQLLQLDEVREGLNLNFGKVEKIKKDFFKVKQKAS